MIIDFGVFFLVLLYIKIHHKNDSVLLVAQWK